MTVGDLWSGFLAFVVVLFVVYCVWAEIQYRRSGL